MERNLKKTHALILGLFTVVAVALLSVGLFAISSKDGWARDSIALESEVSQAFGLRVGAQVRILGIPTGQVTDVRAPENPGEPIVLRLRIDKRHQNLIRSDAQVRIVKDGLVGSRLVEIDPGTAQAPAVVPGAILASAESPDWEELAARVDGMLEEIRQGKGTVGKLIADDEAHQRLLAVASEGERALKQVADVVAEIQHGNGTAGKFLRDDSAYRQFEDLVHRAETVLESMDESHQSLKKTWPVKNLVQDRYSLLVRPDTQMHRRIFREEELFEPGTAILTDDGKANLDAAAEWIRSFDDWESDVVVAGFDRHEEDSRRAALISTKQAETVRDYLKRQGTHRRGWVSRRGIVAQGFGNLQLPREHQNVPAKSVMLLAFLK